MTSGSQKLTKLQYQAMRIVADAFRHIPSSSSGSWKNNNVKEDMRKGMIVSLPHFTTLASTVKPLFFKWLTVRAVDTEVPVDIGKAGAQAKTYTADGTPQTSVRIVLPSEYARQDVATCFVFDLMRSTSLTHFTDEGHCQDGPAVRAEECVDLWPVVAARELFYGPPRRIYVDRQSPGDDGLLPRFAEPGDSISMSVIGCADFRDQIAASFGQGACNDGYAQLNGEIVAVWPVQHVSRKGCVGYEHSTDSDLFTRDKTIVDHLSYLDYRSPSDDITIEIPALPPNEYEDDPDEISPSFSGVRKRKRMSPAMQAAVNMRKDALKKKKQQISKAWLNWKKPAVKPGDIACLLRPCSSRSIASHDRIVLIHRFWAENEERRRHALYIPSDADFDQIGNNPVDANVRKMFKSFSDRDVSVTRDVTCCTIKTIHSLPRGLRKYPPISSVGTLENGERYFVYRFLLYWDGFEVAQGKSASGDGFYLVCLNLPTKARCSSNAVRIISLCPPGVKSSTVFKSIEDDLITGMTQGFPDFDATGQPCRIFLDLVGFLGDTPALNASLDTLGHTATSFCHLCRYTKQSDGNTGSRYAGQGTYGICSGVGRSFYLHAAVRDCSTQKETCRLLGMKPSSENRELPLHSLRKAMMEARSNIPRTSQGIQLLSGHLDPYMACFVAPDHLLTSHFRDCVNLAFKLLPDTQSRVLSEKYMIGYLTDCKLQPQNRLFDMEKKALFSMSMSELYALSIVAQLAFLNAINAKEQSSIPGQLSYVSKKCTDAIYLVGSASRLIASLWRLPVIGNDASSTLSNFNSQHGSWYLSRLQHALDFHLAKIRDLCNMNIDDVVELEEGPASRQLG